MTTQQDKPQASRRRFVTGAAAAGGAAALGFPMIVKAQGPISMRWQSTWPAKDIFHEYANDFAKKVNDMTGGELKIEVLPAGAVVPAFGLLDAVSKGTLDGGHGVLVYHYGKQNALALWGSGPAFGMDAQMLMAWHKYGGGRQLLEKLYAAVGGNVVSFPYGPMFTQPLGWYKKPITKVDDFKGLKFRTVGISIDVFTGMGAAVNALPGGEIVPAMDRGLLDAAEFNNMTSDKILGFPEIFQYMFFAYAMLGMLVYMLLDAPSVKPISGGKAIVVLIVFYLVLSVFYIGGASLYNPDAAQFNFWSGANWLNHSFRGAVSLQINEGAQPGLHKVILYGLDLAFIVFAAALIMLRKEPRDALAIDASILLIATLMLSPMTSRSHYVVMVLPYVVLSMVVLRDQATRRIGIAVMTVSFFFLTASSNDLVGQTVTNYAYAHSYLVIGAMTLLIYIAVIVWNPATLRDAKPYVAPWPKEPTY